MQLKETINGLQLIQKWKGNVCKLWIYNPSDTKKTVSELEIYENGMPFSPDTKCYGEGYNKLCQYGGNIAKFNMTGSHGDEKHYHLFSEEGYSQCYNMILFMPEGNNAVLMGFTSCNRFSGIFRFNEEKIRILINMENMEIQPGEILELEQFFSATGEKNELLKAFGEEIKGNGCIFEDHEIPTGWCSWLAYGPNVTEENIYDNLHAIKENGLDLKYIQIDDGYQTYMGDWLYPTDKFKSGMKQLCLDIKKEGFEPAIWVAPFIAQKESRLFTEHPDWFVKDEEGKPVPSSRYTFGGWRCGPWYMLDGSHPEAQRYLTEVFRTMREDWNIKYYKLDANMWGAMPFGNRFKKNVTSVEAYRMGMQAILKGAGKESFLLGCNAPMWPSIGMVHGMRITNDMSRSYKAFRERALECFPRNWQNGRLWINDPDTVLLDNRDMILLGPDGKNTIQNGTVSWKEFLFCASYVMASGGMILNGDCICVLSKEQIGVLKKMLPSTGIAAEFNDSYEIGWIQQSQKKRRLFLFNYEEEKKDYQVEVLPGERVKDFWSGKEETALGGRYHVMLDGHSAKIVDFFSEETF